MYEEEAGGEHGPARRGLLGVRGFASLPTARRYLTLWARSLTVGKGKESFVPVRIYMVSMLSSRNVFECFPTRISLAWRRICVKASVGGSNAQALAPTFILFPVIVSTSMILTQ